jgi:hypothetical protein
MRRSWQVGCMVDGVQLLVYNSFAMYEATAVLLVLVLSTCLVPQLLARC